MEYLIEGIGANKIGNLRGIECDIFGINCTEQWIKNKCITVSNESAEYPAIVQGCIWQMCSPVFDFPI